MKTRISVIGLLLLGQIVLCGKNSAISTKKNTQQKISDSIAKIILSRIALQADKIETMHDSMRLLSENLPRLMIAYGVPLCPSPHNHNNTNIFTLSKL